MDSKEYLISYGWKEGEAFKEGGLKRPILVKHKRDKKGLGNAPGGNDGEAWWERLFDGHLKNLDVSTDSSNGSIKFTQNEVLASAVSKSSSPLYRWFVKGKGLKGTIDNDNFGEEKEVSFVVSSATSNKAEKKRSRSDYDDNKAKRKKLKKDKKSNDDSKRKKEEKVKKGNRKGKKSKHTSNGDDKSKRKKSKKSKTSKEHKKEKSLTKAHKKKHL